jgi:hypothetical protein
VSGRWQASVESKDFAPAASAKGLVLA